THRAAANNPGCHILDCIGYVAFDRSFSIHGFAQHIHDTPQEALADRHLQQLARAAHLVSLLEFGVVPQHHHTNFSFIQVHRQTSDATAEVEHFVEHRVGKTFHPGHTITDLADYPNVLLASSNLTVFDLSFNFL